MISIKSIAELAFRQLFPNKGDKTSNLFVEILESTKLKYARKVWEINRADKQSGDGDNVPSHLLKRGEITYKDGYASYEHLEPLLGLSKDSWIQAIGSYNCGECHYDKMTLNEYRMFCNDGSIENKPYIVISKEIHFPEGVYDNPVPILYVSVDSDMEIDDAIGDMVKEDVVASYSRKFFVDTTNDSNPTK